MMKTIYKLLIELIEWICAFVMSIISLIFIIGAIK